MKIFSKRDIFDIAVTVLFFVLLMLGTLNKMFNNGAFLETTSFVLFLFVIFDRSLNWVVPQISKANR